LNNCSGKTKSGAPKDIVIKSQADNVEDDAEEWVVVEIECIGFLIGIFLPVDVGI